MEKWELLTLLSPMGDSYFTAYKTKLTIYTDVICPKKENHVASSLLDLLFKENILKALTKEQFSGIMGELFPEPFKDSKWLIHYLEEMVNYIPDTQEKLHLVGRSARYYNYLTDVVAKMRNASADKKSDITLDTLSLIDYAKFIIAVNAVNEHNVISKTEEDNLSFDITAEDTDLLLREMLGTLNEEEEVVSTEVPKTEKQKGILQGIKMPAIRIELPKKPKHTFRTKEKALALLLTWLLYYRIREQDGAPAEEVNV